MPLRDTKNLFVQDNANLYELVEGDPIETTSELFDELTEAPYLPLYKTFSNIFARRNELGVSPLESDDVIEAFGVGSDGESNGTNRLHRRSHTI